MKRNFYIGVGLLGAILLLAVTSGLLEKRAAVEAAGVQAPAFEVDPLWPKPLPNHWVMGMTIGLAVDARDHVWVVHRQQSVAGNERALTLDPPSGLCCEPAPWVLEFDPEGNLVGHWGGPGEGYEWPESNHGITIDYKGNVWIGGNGQQDAHVSSSPERANSCSKSAIPAKPEEAMTSRTLAGPPKFRWTPRPTRFTSPTATATGA